MSEDDKKKVDFVNEPRTTFRPCYDYYQEINDALNWRKQLYLIRRYGTPESAELVGLK